MATLFTPSTLPPDAAHPPGSPVKAGPHEPQPVLEVVPVLQVVPVPEVVPVLQVVPEVVQEVVPVLQVVPEEPEVMPQWWGHNARPCVRTGRSLDRAFRRAGRTPRQLLTEAQRDALSRLMLGQARLEVPASERVQVLPSPRLRRAGKAARYHWPRSRLFGVSG